MFLALDIGNTNVVLGLYKGARLVAHFRLSSDLSKTSDDYGALLLPLLQQKKLKIEKLQDIVICSVVPPLTRIFWEVSCKYLRCPPYVVGTHSGEPFKTLNLPVKNLYKNPYEVGADRLVNAVAAHALYRGTCIVVDFGTATTFDVVTKEGAYLGGVIAPGIGSASETLFSKTAKLPRVDVGKPAAAIGKTTVESMQSGIFFGFAGLVDNIVSRIKNELKDKKAKVVATGGLAELISSGCESIHEVHLTLTLEGIRITYEKQQGKH